MKIRFFNEVNTFVFSKKCTTCKNTIRTYFFVHIFFPEDLAFSAQGGEMKIAIGYGFKITP